MAKTVINVVGIVNSSWKVESVKNSVGSVESNIGGIRSRIDSKILNRNNINGRLINVQNAVGQIEADIERIRNTVTGAALKYQTTENIVIGYAQQIGIVNYRDTSSGSSGKYDAFFANASIEELTLKAAVGVLAYQNGDDSITLFGAEYENDLLHLFDEETLNAYFAKFEIGDSEHYLAKLGISDETGMSGEFEIEKWKDLAEKKLKEKGLLDETKDKTYYDENGNEISGDDKDFYDRKVTIGEIDKTVGVSASLYEGNFSNSLGQGGKVGVTVGNAEAHAGISAGFYVIGDDGTKKFSPGVKAEVGTSVTALEVEWEQQWLGNENLGFNTDVTATVGKAEAAADVTAQIFGENGELDFQLGASASAEAIAGEIEGTAAVNVLGGEIGVTGGVNFGVGAHADVGYRDGVFKVDLGVSVGLGVSLDVEVDIGGMVNTVTDGVCAAVDKAEALWDDVKDGWDDFWPW